MFKPSLLFVFIGGLIISGLSGCGGGASNNTGSSDSVIENDKIETEYYQVQFTSQPEPITKDAYAEFAFSANAQVDFQCRLDNEDFINCTSPYAIFPLTTGEHQLSVRAINEGQVVSDTIRFNWIVSSIFGDEPDPLVHLDLVSTTIMPSAVMDNSWRGILRINCDFSHTSNDDPIVFPGQDGAAHLHRFYGNMLLDENSDTHTLFTSGESTCQGNTLNRSSYWIPALQAPLYDPDSGERQTDELGEPAWQTVPAVVGNDDEAHEVFYYSAGVDDLEAIQTIPLGLKMIAGNHMGQPDMEQDTAIVRWHCQSWESSDASNPRWSTSIPECIAPDRLRMDIFFPSCWNGTDLDSSNHKDHMAYPIDSGGPAGMICPATHPVPIVRVSFHYAFGVKPEWYDPISRSSRGWRLSSDMYEVNTLAPGGMSLHGDWFNAWHPEALQAILDGCIKNQLDCHDGNLGNGFRLTGTRPGPEG